MLLSLVLRPDSATGGLDGPKAPAGRLEETAELGKSNSAPSSIWVRPRPGSVAGFQNIAPAGLSGAAVATPPKERFTAPAPERTAPYCARALPAPLAARKRPRHQRTDVAGRRDRFILVYRVCAALPL